jgi:hypothetical protein
MRNLLSAVGFTGLALVLAACGNGDDRAGAIEPGGKGGKGSGGFAPAAGKTGANEGGGGSGSEAADPLAPVVNITAPAGVDNPNEGVISGTEIEVVCSASKSSEADAEDVDRASVKLQLLDADGELVEEKPGAPTNNADEYSNTFIVTDYAAGPIGFRCTADDEAGSHSGEHEIGTFLDKGPIITFIAPEAESAHALGEVLSVAFTVEPSLLSEDDEGATVESVILEAGGIAIDLADAEEEPGVYRLPLDLTDATLFTPAPNGSFPLTVSATNSRSPAAVTAVATQTTAVDGTGPTLAITFPGNEAVVGGKVPLTFEVSDEVSGMDPESIVVTLNSVAHPYRESDPNWGRPMANTFVYEFDSRVPLVVGDAKVQITVNIDAKDKVGNPAEVAASVLLYLDNYPPSVDLDPLNIRAINEAGECSISFDPLGPLAVNDQETIGTAGTFRALVWENTNSLEGLEVLYHAGTDPDRTRLYLQPAGALLVNTDADEFCDDVADPESDASFALDAVPPRGTPWWDHDDGEYPTTASLGCETKDPDPPEPIECSATVNSDMWQVIRHADGEDVVYGVQVAANTCTGSGWEFGSLVSTDGWVCFAARAVDEVENVGVSRPLRVCVDDPGVAGVPACKTGAPPPSCTDGCTPAPRWDGRYVVLD